MTPLLFVLFTLERMKYLQYHGKSVNRYFWRTHTQQEIDYIEEYGGKLHAYEFKWNPAAKAKFPKAFLEAYPGSEVKVITRENFQDFVMGSISPAHLAAGADRGGAGTSRPFLYH